MPSALENDIRVGIEQQAALSASEYRPGHEGVGVCEGMTGYCFLQAIPLAVGAFELSVEGIELFGRGGKLVFKSLDGLFDELWIHRNEVHSPMVGYGG